jgi:hypothetical protein
MSEWQRYLLYRFILGGAVLACALAWWLLGKARRAFKRRAP